MAGKGGWTKAERECFLEEFMESGDPKAAAIAAGHSLVEAFRLHEQDSGFAASWDWAIARAWDRVRLRIVAGLLGQSGGGAPIDPRITLAVLRAGGPEMGQSPEADEVRRLVADVEAA